MLESYFCNRRFRVIYEEAKSSFFPIQAGVPLGSILRFTIYLFYIADVLTNSGTVLATFVDGTAVMSVNESQTAATINLQRTLNRITQWTNDWKIKLN